MIPSWLQKQPAPSAPADPVDPIPPINTVAPKVNDSASTHTSPAPQSHAERVEPVAQVEQVEHVAQIQPTAHHSQNHQHPEQLEHFEDFEHVEYPITRITSSPIDTDLLTNLVNTVKAIVEDNSNNHHTIDTPMPDQSVILHIPTTPPTTATPAVIYLRVSDKPDHAKDVSSSLQAQLQSCLTFAKHHNLHPHILAIDPHVSGTSTKRPRLFDAIQSLQKGHTLIVHRLDRISRDLLLFTTIQREIESQGAHLKSTQGEGTIDDSPQSRMIREILTSVANYERAITAQRTAAAMRHKSQKHQRNSSRPPWGWLYHGNTITPDPQRCHLLLWMAKNHHLPNRKIFEYVHLEIEPHLRKSLQRTTINRILNRIKADQHPIPSQAQVTRTREAYLAQQRKTTKINNPQTDGEG